MEPNFEKKPHCLEMHHVCANFPSKTLALVALFWKSTQMIFVKYFFMIGQYQSKSENKENILKETLIHPQYSTLYPNFGPNY